MANSVDKIIVSNRAALTAKYGNAGVAKIKAAVTALIAADAKRSIRSRLVFLDDAVAMKGFKGRAVTIPTNTRENKAAIDAIFRTANPAYLMILGAPDVVSQQDTANPAFAPPDDDPDEFAYSDLPYACDAPYSRDVAKFKGPTRVVGRLPDLMKQSGAPTHLLSLLRTARGSRRRSCSPRRPRAMPSKRQSPMPQNTSHRAIFSF
jgi:hypothetical protein